MRSEFGPESSPVYDILDLIGKGVTIRDDILKAARESAQRGGNQPNLESMEYIAKMFNLIDQIEIEEIEQTSYSNPFIDRERGEIVTIQLGLKAEERARNIIQQFDDLVFYAETTPVELDHEGVDLMIHFYPQTGLPDTGVQVKSSYAGIQKFLTRPNLQQLFEKYNLIILKVNPHKSDREIHSYLDRIFKERLAQVSALTKAS